MKRPAQQVLAIALVATALCADRAVAAAPRLRPQVADVAGRLVNTLSVRIRRVVPAVTVVQVRRDDQSTPAGIPLRPITTRQVGPRLLPQLLHLPPPLA